MKEPSSVYTNTGAVPLNKLTPEEHEKQIKFGMRGYEVCAHTLKRIINIGLAVYDKELDLMFYNNQARLDYYADRNRSIAKAAKKAKTLSIQAAQPKKAWVIKHYSIKQFTH